MNGPQSLWIFSGLMWVAQFSPGPDMLLLLKNALNHSRRSALATVLGITCGLCVHCAIILSGLAVILQESPPLFAALRLAGGLYLTYLGAKLLWSTRHSPRGPTSAESPVLSSRGAFAQGLLTNLLNAKAVLFLLGAFAAFHPAHSAPWLKWALAGIVAAQALIGWSFFVCLLSWPPLRTLFLRWERPWNTLFGVLLITAGLAAVWVT